MTPTLRVHSGLDPVPCRAALIWARGIRPPLPSESLEPQLAELVERARREGEALWPAGTRERVRQMLRHGRYRPSGRGKPASEFLLKAALGGRFPQVNPPVDANNAISLESGLPGSIFDGDLCGDRLLLRRGLPGERYVFNPAGQEIDLADLLLVARGTEQDNVPCGNPVKDSMATKIRPETRDVIAVLYAPADFATKELEGWARRFVDLLGSWCGATSADHDLLSSR